MSAVLRKFAGFINYPKKAPGCSVKICQSFTKAVKKKKPKVFSKLYFLAISRNSSPGKCFLSAARRDSMCELYSSNEPIKLTYSVTLCSKDGREGGFILISELCCLCRYGGQGKAIYILDGKCLAGIVVLSKYCRVMFSSYFMLFIAGYSTSSTSTYFMTTTTLLHLTR